MQCFDVVNLLRTANKEIISDHKDKNFNTIFVFKCKDWSNGRKEIRNCSVLILPVTTVPPTEMSLLAVSWTAVSRLSSRALFRSAWNWASSCSAISVVRDGLSFTLRLAV